jgi:hypothetical protein
MAQIKIYGIKEKLAPIRERLSEVIHECVMEALQFPADKRAHRFFLMEKEDMIYPRRPHRCVYDHRNNHD